MAKTKFTYQMLVTKLSKTADDKKAEVLKSHVINQYVDYQSKLTDIKIIAKTGNYSSITDPESGEEREFFKRNTPAMFYLLKLRLISHYTDIDIKPSEELEAYNALEEIGVLDELIKMIPDTEITKWQTMLQMVNDDIYMNERDFASYFDTKIDALGMVMNMMLSSLGELTGKLELAQNEN